MRMGPTLNGGMRIDAENSMDWDIIRCIVLDAGPAQFAARLTNRMGRMAEEWREFVLPELQATFEGQVAKVYADIVIAVDEAGEGAGSLYITKSSAEDWYATLNLARFSLHERHKVAEEDLDFSSLDSEGRWAFIRYEFYGNIQSLLIERVMS